MSFLVPLREYTLLGFNTPVPVDEQKEWLSDHGVAIKMIWQFDSSSGMYAYHMAFDDELLALEFKLAWG